MISYRLRLQRYTIQNVLIQQLTSGKNEKEDSSHVLWHKMLRVKAVGQSISNNYYTLKIMIFVKM